MLSVSDTVCGWSPIGGDDEDVNISPDMGFMAIKPFHTTSNILLSSVCPPLDTTLITCPPQMQSPPTPPTGVTRTSAPSSDRRAQRNRNRDPSWIPRPRNAFIIFRCEYSREHSQGTQEPQSDDDSSNSTVKTLSKRAADAWKQLSADERERYKMLADKEREEHARMYPHYRFRPMKRQMSGTGKTSQERSQDPRGPSSERICDPLTHFPSVLAPAPDKLGPGLCIDTRTESPLPLSMDYNNALLPYSLPDVTLRSDSSSPSAPVEFPLCSTGSISHDKFRCHDSTVGIDLSQEDAERTQALEAYTIGLYNHDLFSPFSFPEYY